MQFIEQLLGLTPDGGSGLTEITLFTAALIGVLLLCLRVTSRQQRSGDQQQRGMARK